MKAFSFVFAVFAPFAAADPVSINNLAWMTGHWQGPASHGGVIEENWIAPHGGTIANLARLSTEGKVEIIEMILIEEEAGSLVLRLQQWAPGYIQQLEQPQKLRLTDIGESMIRFESVDDGPLKSLQYHRPTPETFVIHFQDERGMFEVKLKRTN